MAQVFNLSGTPIQTVAELRTDLVTDQTGQLKIIEVDATRQGVILHNVEYIYTKGGREITANNIVVNT